MILASDKSPMDGSNYSEFKKNDGLGRIRTGDLRRVKTEVSASNLALSVFAALFCAAVLRDPTTTKKASSLHALFDRHAFEGLQAVRTRAAAVSLGSYNRLLHDGAIFCCGESPAARFLAAQRRQRDLGNDQQLTNACIAALQT